MREAGRVVPIVPSVLRSHPRLIAKGIHVEHHAVEPMEFRERELLQHNLFLYTGPTARAEIKSPEFTGVRWIHPGSLWIMPEGSRHSVRFESHMTGVALAFQPGSFDALLQAAGGKHSAPVVQSLAACPPKIEHLMCALAEESREPSAEDGFGLECIATAIALSLCQHAGATAIASKAGPQLAPKQVRSVCAYIDDHLRESLSLAQMAEVAGLSSFHFLRAFKGSLGVTPSHYVLHRRVERAKALLETSDLLVAEVGVGVGFDHVSHFSRAFRKLAGVTPSAFRLECRK